MHHQANTWQLASATTLPNHVPSNRLTFFSESLPEGARNIHHVYAPVIKHGVVLEGDAPWEAGGFMTPVFFPQIPELLVDADVRGWLRAELCDAWGRKIEGYHLENSIAIQGDKKDHILRWQGQETHCFQHDPLRLRFEFADADIYWVKVGR
ncbi:MAG: hypothetical protein P1S60_05350 [Anaerolineae bacterium]|nr:hypothetical protein [Anaerolineae bacterium]